MISQVQNIRKEEKNNKGKLRIKKILKIFQNRERANPKKEKKSICLVKTSCWRECEKNRKMVVGKMENSNKLK